MVGIGNTSDILIQQSGGKYLPGACSSYIGEIWKVVFDDVGGIDLNMKSHAFSFVLAAERCCEQRAVEGGQIQSLLVPAVVMYSFACEVYLKAILEGEGKSIKKHDLHDLFSEITSEKQLLIISKTQSGDFWTELRNASKGFEHFRYLYEKDSGLSVFPFLRSLSAALNEITP